jgi:hypothetical protein
MITVGICVSAGPVPDENVTDATATRGNIFMSLAATRLNTVEVSPFLYLTLS